MILYTVWYTLSSKLSILFVSCLLLFRFIKRQQQSHKTKHLPYKQGVIGSSPIVPTKCGPVVQLVRTLACHARGRRFDPDPGRQFASVAQSVEQGTENPRVIGSIPIGGTINADVAHPVERHLAKVEVASSSLVIRSKKDA